MVVGFNFNFLGISICIFASSECIWNPISRCDNVVVTLEETLVFNQPIRYWVTLSVHFNILHFFVCHHSIPLQSHSVAERIIAWIGFANISLCSPTCLKNSLLESTGASQQPIKWIFRKNVELHLMNEK